MDCDDVLSVVVAAILALAAEDPAVAATSANIYVEATVLCPTSGFVPGDITTAITLGVHDGVLLPCINDAMQTVYEIRNNMVELRPTNIVYYNIVNPPVTPACPAVDTQL